MSAPAGCGAVMRFQMVSAAKSGLRLRPVLKPVLLGSARLIETLFVKKVGSRPGLLRVLPTE